MSILERFWKRMSGGEAAERAELAGNFPEAVRLWMTSGQVDEAARVMTLRGDSEPDPKLRLQHYTQAAATASAGSDAQKIARVKRAKLTIALAEGGTLSTALRRDVIEAATELETSGDAAAAAEAYALAGDVEGEARALTLAGDVDRLETLLAGAQRDATRARKTKAVHAEVDDLIGAGHRRDALTLAEGAPDDPLARARVARLRGARILGPVIHVTLRGRRISLILGSEVVIGRTEGAITVPSSALSRRHVRIDRTATGSVAIHDLESRNGTQLRGMNLALPLEVGDGVDVTLGGEVSLRVAPSKELAGAVAIEVAGDRYVAFLGSAQLGVAAWSLAMGADGWVELATEGGEGAFVGELALAKRVTLLRGDALAMVRSGEVVLRVEE